MKDKKNVTTFDKIVIFLLIGIVPLVMQGTTYNMPSSGGTLEMFDYFKYSKVFVIKTIALIIVFNKISDILILDRVNIAKKTSLSEKLKQKLKTCDRKIFFVSLIIFSVILSYCF